MWATSDGCSESLGVLRRQTIQTQLVNAPLLAAESTFRTKKQSAFIKKKKKLPLSLFTFVWGQIVLRFKKCNCNKVYYLKKYRWKPVLKFYIKELNEWLHCVIISLICVWEVSHAYFFQKWQTFFIVKHSNCPTFDTLKSLSLKVVYLSTLRKQLVILLFVIWIVLSTVSQLCQRLGESPLKLQYQACPPGKY